MAAQERPYLNIAVLPNPEITSLALNKREQVAGLIQKNSVTQLPHISIYQGIFLAQDLGLIQRYVQFLGSTILSYIAAKFEEFGVSDEGLVYWSCQNPRLERFHDLLDLRLSELRLDPALNTRYSPHLILGRLVRMDDAEKVLASLGYRLQAACLLSKPVILYE